MSATITSPGYWFVLVPKTKQTPLGGAGIVHYTKAVTLPQIDQAIYLGAHSVNQNNLKKAIVETNAVGLYEYAGGLPQLISDAEQNGKAVIYQTPGNAQWDLLPTAFFAGLSAVLGAGAIAGASGAAEVAAGAGAAGAADAGLTAAGAGGTAATAGKGLLSGAAKSVGSTAAKDATSSVGLAAVAGIVAKLEGWNLVRILEVIGGALLLLFGLKQLADAAKGPQSSTTRTRVIPV